MIRNKHVCFGKDTFSSEKCHFTFRIFLAFHDKNSSILLQKVLFYSFPERQFWLLYKEIVMLPFFGNLSENFHDVKHCLIVSLLPGCQGKRVSRYTVKIQFSDVYRHIFYVTLLFGLLGGNNTLVNPLIFSSVYFTVSYISLILWQIILFPWSTFVNSGYNSIK